MVQMGLVQELEYDMAGAEAGDSSLPAGQTNMQEDETPAGKERPIYTEGDIGPVEDTYEQKKLKRLYKISGEPVEDVGDPEGGDEERKHQVSAMKIPDYTGQKTLSSPSSHGMKASVPEKNDYKAQGGPLNMEPQAALKSAGYVCAPGSKGACATCPVYSIMARMLRVFEPNVGKELFKGATYTQSRLI